MQQKNKLFSTVNLIKMSLLAVIAVILMQFGAIRLPAIFPSFLELDFSELPAILGILTVHPLAGVVIVILKNVLNGTHPSTKKVFLLISFQWKMISQNTILLLRPSFIC